MEKYNKALKNKKRKYILQEKGRKSCIFDKYLSNFYHQGSSRQLLYCVDSYLLLHILAWKNLHKWEKPKTLLL